MQVLKPRFATLSEAVAWLLEQKGVLPDYKNHELLILRTSLRTQGALDYVAKCSGVRVYRQWLQDAALGMRNRAVVEGLGGIL